MSDKDAKVLLGGVILTLVCGVAYFFISRAEKKRGGVPTRMERYITDHAWVLVPAPVVIFVLEYVTGFASFLYNVFEESEPTTTVGVMVGGVPIMGTGFFFVLVATFMVAVIIGMPLTMLIVWALTRD